MLTARQLTDWYAFGAAVNINIDRDDSFWGQHLAMYFNAHRPQNANAMQPTDFIPWYSPTIDLDIDPQELRRKLGFSGTR